MSKKEESMLDVQEAVNQSQLSPEKIREYLETDLRNMDAFIRMCRSEPSVLDAIASALHARYVHESSDEPKIEA